MQRCKKRDWLVNIQAHPGRGLHDRPRDFCSHLPPDPDPIRFANMAWCSPVNQRDVSTVRLHRQPEGLTGLSVAEEAHGHG